MTTSKIDPKLAALCAHLDIPTTHWTYGAGQFGCLYDYGPERAQTKTEAIAALETVLELNDRERNWLEQDDVAHFTGGRPAFVGHAYCEVCEQPDPIDDDGNDIDETYDDLYGYGTGFAANGRTYVVLTCTELNRAVDAAVDSYIDDCILPELPETAQRYFNREAFKRDVDCNGEGPVMLAGEVNEEVIDGEWYHIIRVD